MLQELEKKVADFLTAAEFSFSKTSLLLAVSGGADSIALLYVLHALKSHGLFTGELYCAHINHQLRDDAGRDEEFVISQAEKLQIPVTTKHLDVPGFARVNKLSIETAARQLRIESLIEIAKANKCSMIATGHQKNDNAETVIHRLLRGTGMRGLAGIWPVRKFDGKIFFVRPLLCATRDEIIKYLRLKNLMWREDYTNAEYLYTRNRIRHKLLPALQKQCKGSLVEQISELSIKAESFYKLVYRKAEKLWPEISSCNNNKVILKHKIFQSQSPSEKVELIRRALASLGCGERDLTSLHYQKILKLIQQNSTHKKIQLPNGFLVQVEYENIIFVNRMAGFAQPNETKSINLIIPGQTKFNDYLIRTSVHGVDSRAGLAQPVSHMTKKNILSETWYLEHESFDLDKIKPPLTVRYRQTGDRFIPLGQKSEKKIGKFLTAQRVPEEIRNKALVITDTEKIIWLWPVRICEQTKISSETRRILQLRITNIEPV
ncbi:MAG: tRNA lysidine(34) synthetase TilS [Sedimentisphaerales bacterium]|nr:tRNA lysidine(34) synthetase TilS [Sedimentisphaerales bacterium]